jgi:hypothetical protein
MGPHKEIHGRISRLAETGRNGMLRRMTFYNAPSGSMWGERQTGLSTKRLPSTSREQKTRLAATVSADTLGEDTALENLLSIMTGAILHMGW